MFNGCPAFDFVPISKLDSFFIHAIITGCSRINKSINQSINQSIRIECSIRYLPVLESITDFNLT